MATMRLLPNKAESEIQRPREKGAPVPGQLQPSQARGCCLGPKMPRFPSAALCSRSLLAAQRGKITLWWYSCQRGGPVWHHSSFCCHYHAARQLHRPSNASRWGRLPYTSRILIEKNIKKKNPIKVQDMSNVSESWQEGYSTASPPAKWLHSHSLQHLCNSGIANTCPNPPLQTSAESSTAPPPASIHPLCSS